MATGGFVHWQDPQGWQACRPAGRAVLEVRAGDQRRNRPNARPDGTTNTDRHRQRGDRMIRRREFIALLGGAPAAWSLAARAQQGERIRRVGVLIGLSADDPQVRLRMDAFLQTLRQLGWIEGRNIQVDFRFGDGDNDKIRKYAEELVVLAPDVIVTPSSATMGALLHVTQTIPIVFASVPDPVGAGFVESLARPGGNATGFTIFEYSITGKLLELLNEVAPRVMRVAFVREAGIAAASGQFGALQTAA